MHRDGVSGWAVFQSHDFRLFCAARFLSGLSRQAQNVAMQLFVYDVTDSAWALGLAGLFTFAPSIVFAFLTGHVADAFDRRLVATLAHAAAALSAAGLFVCAWFEIEIMWPVYALAALAGASRVFGNPATHALVPNLVPRDRFGSAVGWDQTISQAATISSWRPPVRSARARKNHSVSRKRPSAVAAIARREASGCW